MVDFDFIEHLKKIIVESPRNSDLSLLFNSEIIIRL